jgi:hypothetical protein
LTQADSSSFHHCVLSGLKVSKGVLKKSGDSSVQVIPILKRTPNPEPSHGDWEGRKISEYLLIIGLILEINFSEADIYSNVGVF